VWLAGLGKLKKLNDLIGNQTRGLPACSIVPQSNNYLLRFIGNSFWNDGAEPQFSICLCSVSKPLSAFVAKDRRKENSFPFDVVSGLVSSAHE
jgi:hypothetical protein